MSNRVSQESMRGIVEERSYKQLNDVTELDVKNEALMYAEQFGVTARPEDCGVTSMHSKQVINESGGPTTIHLPVSRWIVTITPSAVLSKVTQKVLVAVEYLDGSVCAMDLKPYPLDRFRA